MRDHRRDVEPGLDHDGHLVPGLVHLAAVDALQRQHVEDDRGEVDRHLARLDPEQRDPAAVGHRRQESAERTSLPDISSATSKPSVIPRSRWISSSPVCVGSIAAVAPIVQRQLAPVRVRVGDDDVARAGVPDDGDGHAADRPGAGDEHVLAEHREGERGVHGVPERVEDRRHVLGDSGPVVPDVRHRQRHVLRERARAAARRARSSARTGGGARPCSCGSARRRRAPRR